MFESSLKDSLKSIFDIKKVSYDRPSDSFEQEVLFVEIETSRNSIKDTRQIARVTGIARYFAQADKLPFGYFSKKIHESDPVLTRPFYFYEIEENSTRYRNIVERSLRFEYFFDSQYDPDQGIIDELTLSHDE